MAPNARQWPAAALALALAGCAADRTSAPDARQAWERGTVAVPAPLALAPAEADLVLHLNLARTDPQRYASLFLQPRLSLFTGSLFRNPLDPDHRGYSLETTEGTAVVDEAIRDLAALAPMGALTLSPLLSRAARDHVDDQSRSGATGHRGSDGSTLDERIGRYGRWHGTIGEVIAYGPDSGREAVARLLIDDGVPGRGHRRNILNPRFRLAGVAFGSHPRFGRMAVVCLATEAL